MRKASHAMIGVAKSGWRRAAGERRFGILYCDIMQFPFFENEYERQCQTDQADVGAEAVLAF